MSIAEPIFILIFCMWSSNVPSFALILNSAQVENAKGTMVSLTRHIALTSNWESSTSKLRKKNESKANNQVLLGQSIHKVSNTPAWSGIINNWQNPKGNGGFVCSDVTKLAKKLHQIEIFWGNDPKELLQFLTEKLCFTVDRGAYKKGDNNSDVCDYGKGALWYLSHPFWKENVDEIVANRHRNPKPENHISSLYDEQHRASKIDIHCKAHLHDDYPSDMPPCTNARQVNTNKAGVRYPYCRAHGGPKYKAKKPRQTRQPFLLGSTDATEKSDEDDA